MLAFMLIYIILPIILRCLRTYFAFTSQHARKENEYNCQPLDIPYSRLLLDEFFHQILAFLVFEYHNLDSSLLQVTLTPDERRVLSNNNSGDLV